MLTIQKSKKQVKNPNKVININDKSKKSKAEEKRERNRDILKNKYLDYELKLDKGQLKADKKLTKIKKDNEFKYKEVEIKCNIKNLALKAGYTLGRVCLVLTFISCLLTFGGNIANFICNIPLTKNEAEVAVVVWKKFDDTYEMVNGVKTLNYIPQGFNILTSLIYIPFLLGMQSILYQISLTIYIIKTRFKEYYKYAILLQFSMLFYSVYSNYMFITYYVKPDTIIDKFMCFIPSLLLDISCIFFLSLSMRMKTLNFDDKELDKQQNLLLNGLTKFNDFKSNFKSKKNKNLDLNKSKNSTVNSDNKKRKLRLSKGVIKGKYTLKNKEDLNKLLKIKKLKDSNNISFKKEKNINAVSTGNSSDGNKNTVKKTDKNKGKFKSKECTGQGTNKVKDKELNKVRNFIENLKLKGLETVNITELKKKCKIDKNKWLELKQKLIKEGLIYTLEDKPRTTYISQ